MPTRLTGCGAPARVYSALKMATCRGDAPRPPYSWGQWMPTQRPSASSACQARPQATSSSTESNAGTGRRCSSSQARASAAKACSSVVKVRSTSTVPARPPVGRPAGRDAARLVAQVAGEGVRGAPCGAKLTLVSTFRRTPNTLAPTFRHPLTDRWAQPGGPWSDESLDAALSGTTPFEQEIAEIAGGLAALGVEPGSTVSWQLANGWPAISLFRACWRLGAVAAPIHHLAGASDVDAMIARLDPSVFVRSDAELPSGAPIPTSVVEVDAASVAVALGTSGSTGTPKVALHSHRALLHKARVMTEVHGLGSEDAILLPAPMAHISG